jgi:hypothetical protein
MELQGLYTALELERKERADMFEAFEERMTSMLENFEIKMRENTDSCKKALNGSMVRFWTAIIAMVQIPGYLCASCSVGFRLH